MKDKRQHERYKADVTKINGTMVLDKNVKILNLSIGGVCIQIKKRPNIGSYKVLRIEGRRKVLTVEGSVMWTLLTGTSVDSEGNIIPAYKAGMKFVNVSNKKLNEIVNFIKEMAERDKEILVEFIRLLDTIDKSPSFVRRKGR